MFKNGKIPSNIFKYTIDGKEVTEEIFIDYITNNFREFYKDIKNNLIKLGFKVDTIGFRYWIEAIKIYKQDGWRYGFTMQYLYNEIAKYYGSTPTRVERSLRTTSNKAKEEIKNKYGYYGKITTKTILELLTNYNLEDYPKVEKLEQKTSYDEILTHIPSLD